MATPSLAMIPSGKKEGVLYSVLPNTSVGDFTVERGSNATFVNQQGLIQDTNVVGGEKILNGNFSEEGSELITNGGFNGNADGWNLQIGWAYNGDKVSKTLNNASYLLQTSVLTIGKTYKVTLTVSDYVSGEVGLNSTFWGVDSLYSANGTYEAIVTTTNENFYIYSDANFVGSIDNVSVKEVGQNWFLDDKWSIVDNAARLVSTDSSAGILSQADVFTVGKPYNITLDAEIVSGDAKLSGAGGSSFLVIDETKTYDIYWVADATSFNINRQSTISDLTITNISVKEVTEATNTPRFDYTDGGCPVLLTEPQRTNEVLHSSDFNNASWDKTQGGVGSASIVTSNYAISPDGTQNADRVQFNLNGGTSVNDFSRLKQSNVSGSSPTISIYIKSNDANTYELNLSYGGGEVGLVTAKPNEWSRVEAQTTPSGAFDYRLESRGSYGTSDSADVLIYGAQAEEGSYATSLIPTYGSPYTRLGEVVKGAGDASTFNSSEGTLFIEAQGLVNGGGQNRYIGISDGTADNRLQLVFSSNSNRLQFGTDGNVGGAISENYNSFIQTDNNKVAVRYSSSGYSLWLNGIEVAQGSTNASWSSSALTTLDLSLWNQSSAIFYGKTSQVQVFNTALSDFELTQLTTI